MIEKTINPGLPFALDAQNNIVTSENAISGEAYRCPWCGCPMHLIITKNRNRVFGRNPNTHHSDETCQVIEIAKVKVRKTFDGIDPHELILRICRAPSSRKTTGDKEPGPKEPGEEKPGEKDTDPDIEKAKKVGPVKTLSEIRTNLLYELPPSAKFSDHCVSEFLVNYKGAKLLFDNREHIDELEVIVYASLEYVYFNPSISNMRASVLFRSKIFDNINDVKGYFCFAMDAKIYGELKDKLTYELIKENGSYGGRRAYFKREVLLASTSWKKIPKPVCSQYCQGEACNRCFGMYLSFLGTKKQIHVFPEKNE